MLSSLADAYYVGTPLNVQFGICSTMSTARAIGVALQSTLLGTLTMTGVNNADGSPAAWVIAAGASGFAAPPAAGLNNTMAFVYANAGDIGKAIFINKPGT